jgi:hypothetical protein
MLRLGDKPLVLLIRICMDTPWSMADHIATQKLTLASAHSSRKRRTHQPSVRTFGRRVSVNIKPEKYELMAKQNNAFSMSVSPRFVSRGWSEHKCSNCKGKANAEFKDFLLPDENIFIGDGVSAKIPLWLRPAAKQMKAFIVDAQ